MKGKGGAKMSVLLGKALLNLQLNKKPSEKFTIKHIYNERLEKLFSRLPSNFGYKSDIEAILNELAITKEQLFQMAVNSLGRSTRTKPEIRVIASYLFLMQDFLKLVKAKSSGEKENILLKDLLTLAETVDYERAQNNTVLMRFGEKGNNAFIILDGKVDVLIESHFQKNMGEKTYLYYLANLIKHHEFGLVNSIVNENFHKFPMEIIDDLTFKNPVNNNFNNKQNKNTSDYNFYSKENYDSNNLEDDDNIGDISIKKSIRNSVMINYNMNSSGIKFSFSRDRATRRNNTYRENKANDNKKQRKKKQGVFKLNYINEEYRDFHKIPQFSAQKLLDMFGLQLIDKRFNRKLNHINTDDYIKRLNIFNYIRSDQLILKIKKDKENQFPKKKKKMKSAKIKRKKKDNSQNNSINTQNNIDNTEDRNSNSSELDESSSDSKVSYIKIVNENILENLKLCTYTKIISLERGSLFGEMALNEPNALRKATIITSSDSHFAVLNKKTFNNSIKMGAQKHMRETLQFFLEIPLFSGIPEGTFYNKYYTNLSKDTIVKGKNVINQGEKPDHITLLQTGSFGLTTQMSLYDLTRLILHYADVLLNQNNKSKNIQKNNKNPNDKENKDKNKNKNNNKKEDNKKEQKKKEENKKGLNNLIDIKKMISHENALLAESISFKKYYFTPQYIRVNEIYCPEVIINDEYTDENGLYAFTIEAKAPENIIYTLNNKFLVDIKEKNISIQKNKEKFIKQKIDLTLKRLLIIRNSLINSFFDSKAKKEIGEAVVKELEDNILLNLRKKRLLNKKEEIIKNNNENDKKEKLTLMNINTQIIKNRNVDMSKQYKNTGDSIQEKKSYNNTYNLKTYRINHKNKSFKNQRNQKSEKGFKEKTNTMYNKKLKLKPINVSLKEAIKHINHNDLINDKKELHHLKNHSNYNEEGPLFSMNDLIITNNNKYIKTNYNWNQSRNNQGKMMLKPFSFSYGDNNYKNYNMAFSKTPKVLINNLIWEKMKTGVKFPIKLNIPNLNNDLENNQISKGNTINTNHQTYYGHKSFYNRNSYTKNKNYINSSNNIRKASSFEKDFSFNNIQIETQNNLCFLSSSSKIKQKQKNKSFSPKKNYSYSKMEQRANQPVKNLKKNEALLKMKMKNLISPQEIHLMRVNRRLRYIMDGNKYNKIKEEKFKSSRKYYFEKNIVNRINYFYGKTEN